jgi:hypothetical protein
LASQINASNSGFGGIVSTGDSSGVLQLQTTGTAAVTIDTSQNVGIGTTSPTTKLSFGNFIPSNGQTLHIYQSGNSISGLGVVSGVYRNYTASDAAMSFGQVSLSDGSTYTERMRIDSSGNVFAGPTATQNGATGVIYSKTTAKAWVTFSGFTGTISSSFNVSSVTRVSTGIYTVNFTSAMPNANYSSFYMAQPTVSNAGADTFTINPTTTTVQCNHWEANTQRDSNYSCVVVFGSA